METGGMSNTNAARFNPLLASAAFAEFSIAALHIEHWANTGFVAAITTQIAMATIKNVRDDLIYLVPWSDTVSVRATLRVQPVAPAQPV